MLDNNTRGTWSFNRFDNSISSDKAGLICYVQGDPGRSEYDGKLMAKAKELYEACQYLYEVVDNLDDVILRARFCEIGDLLDSLDE